MKKTTLILLIIIIIVLITTVFAINQKPNLNTTKTHILKKDLTDSIRKTKTIPLQQEDPIEAIKKTLAKAVTKLEGQFALKDEDMAIVVIISEQKLFLIKDRQVIKLYSVSTSKYGIGNEYGSYKTPLGTHRIQDKIGDGAPIGTIFKSKINTGRIAEITTTTEDLTDEDYVTTRVLPLEGLEYGINRGEKVQDGDTRTVDSYKRAIYIHGTPEEGLIGTKASHGCIRMINTEVIELFDIVETGTLVEIVE
jgi:hypothetical protein